MKWREEQEEREQERKLELAKLAAEKEIKLARIAASVQSPSSASGGGECADRPRLPAYNDVFKGRLSYHLLSGALKTHLRQADKTNTGGEHRNHRYMQRPKGPRCLQIL
ncbi:hypothetical protein Pcinc_006113 [Petrolisthes cinctipes]|uniref:Uncharacterized protein n=1 Tax=Petrolisthes cinctipes TaxID=88211 RepID=A0AAE1GDK8_PETCI|nr:hypothetical protein Pcinc_006113 [Petrolisthes cinctipes]